MAGRRRLVGQGQGARAAIQGKYYEDLPPTTADGVERYLGSGLVKGIGPILAKKLVGRFGTDVLAVIEKRPLELLTVDGIAPKRIGRQVSNPRAALEGRKSGRKVL
jgi:exodeoxyribonuclease V alpha subunit